MSIADPIIVESQDLDDLTGTGDYHRKCCVKDAFYCKAPFHPEAVAGDEDEGCAECEEIREFMRCRRHPGEYHCPFRSMYHCPEGP